MKKGKEKPDAHQRIIITLAPPNIPTFPGPVASLSPVGPAYRESLPPQRAG
jgi:hypothetical protein